MATLSALLDELPSRENLVVVGATSRPGAVNPELRVAGRLKTEVRGNCVRACVCVCVCVCVSVNL